MIDPFVVHLFCFSISLQIIFFQARGSSFLDRWQTGSTICRKTGKLMKILHSSIPCCTKFDIKWIEVPYVGWIVYLNIMRNSKCLVFMACKLSPSQTDALKCIAQASKNRSLADFEKVGIWTDVNWRSCRNIDAVMLSFLFALSCLKALTEYTKELRDDPIINTHLATLYDNLLEQNLIRVIEPFSIVQVCVCAGLWCIDFLKGFLIMT